MWLTAEASKHVPLVFSLGGMIPLCVKGSLVFVKTVTGSLVFVKPVKGSLVFGNGTLVFVKSSLVFVKGSFVGCLLASAVSHIHVPMLLRLATFMFRLVPANM